MFSRTSGNVFGIWFFSQPELHQFYDIIHSVVATKAPTPTSILSMLKLASAAEESTLSAMFDQIGNGAVGNEEVLYESLISMIQVPYSFFDLHLLGKPIF